MLRAKVLAGVPAGTDDGDASERRFPYWGRHLGATLVCTGLWVKTLSRFGTSDGGTLAS